MRTPLALALTLTLGAMAGCERVQPPGAGPDPGASPDPGVDPAPVSGKNPATSNDPALAKPTPRPSPRPSPPVDDPGVPAVDPAELLDAPRRYEHLILRAALPIGRRYADLGYEGNNKHFRGPADADAGGLFRSGDETAADWRTFAAGVAHLVVLRDSLFSQQDHPTLQAPRALMVPPNWVSVAVAEVLAGRTPTAPRSAALDDDAGWAGEDIDAYFGSFPISARLFADARRPLAGADPAEAAMTRNARRSLQALAAVATAMIEAAPEGPAAVAEVGAEWIAASDRSYFGAELRRTTIVPIFVENPNEHEVRDEGKGLGVWGEVLPDEALALTRAAVYGRRLQDGALALERYDLRSEAERERAVALLELLVPRGSTGHPIWLWVNGGSDGHGHGDPALPYIPAFLAQLAAADIEVDRVILLSKPSVQPWGEDAKAILEDAVDAHAKLGIPLSAQLKTGQLSKLIP